MVIHNKHYFRKMARLDKEREQILQPERIDFAKQKLTEKGFEIHFEVKTELRFNYKGNEIKFYPYSGWFSGKGINDGRGIKNLLKQLKND